MNKPTFNKIKKALDGNSFQLEIVNFSDTICYMFMNSRDLRYSINDWLLESFPSFYGTIKQGNSNEFEYVQSKYKYYIGIDIYEN
jgi:hypothetical protein